MGFYPFLTNFLAKCPMFETNQEYVKLDFWNIELQRTWTQKFFFGNRVSCKVLEFMELEFYLNFFKELQFYELEYFTWNLNSRFFF